tara:strand:- start:1574 stop:2284 length:711 start_codon:yes stop_codon:yes gene_type:complete
MSDHYRVVKELLDHSDGIEFVRLTKYINEMHNKCLEKSASSCNIPCTVQNIQRGEFCIYKDGNINELDRDTLERITSLSKNKKCSSLFIRLKPTIKSKIEVVMFIPALISNNTSFESHLMNTLNDKFTVEKGSVTGIGAIFIERPLKREIFLDYEDADDVYTKLTFTKNLSEVTAASRWLLKIEITDILKIWASRFQFTFGEEIIENVHRIGSLVQLKICREFDNYKATSKSAAIL